MGARCAHLFLGGELMEAEVNGTSYNCRYEEGSMFASRFLILLLLAPVGAVPVMAQSLQGSQDKSAVPLSSKPFGSAAPADSRMGVPAFDPLNVAPKNTLTARNEGTCYTIRGYAFTRDDPKSDATRFTGYSTCQAAKQLQLKGTVSGANRR